MPFTRTDFEPNLPPSPNPTQNTLHLADAGITGQIQYPTTVINAYRAGEFCAGHVATLGVADGETWPPADA